MRHDMRTGALYRLFFALRPSPMVARQTDYLAERLARGARRILPEHQHMTLAVTADYVDYPYAMIKALLRAGTTVMAEPFDLALDRLSFSNRSAALRPSSSVPRLKALQRSIIEAMRGVGVALRPGWSFSPHQTLFYREGRPGQKRIEGLHWQVEQFALLCSHVGHTRHETLGTWPLIGSRQYLLL